MYTTARRRKLVSLQEAADHLGVCTRTIRRRIADGTLAGYRIANSHVVRVDLDEVDELARPIPTAASA